MNDLKIGLAFNNRITNSPAPASQGVNRSQSLNNSLLSSSKMGTANRGLVLRVLYDLGATSRAELARIVGVNRTTISGIVQPLIDEHFLVELDPMPATSIGGKPARPLWFSPEASPICGVLLMPDAVYACLVTLDGTVLAENSVVLPSGSGPVEPIAEAIFECVEQILAQSTRSPLGIGVAVGGMVDTDAGAIVTVNLAPALDMYPLSEALGDHFDLPIRMDHHPRALVVGDRWFGSGRGVPQFAAVYTGEVLGGAFYFDGRLYRGAAGAGGELGHTFVQIDGEKCRCGQRGCWDTIATLGWLRREAKAVGLSSPETMDAGRLTALAEDGNEAAKGLLDRYACNLAIGLANLQQTLAPNHYILHGDVALGGDRLIGLIKGHLKRLVPARPNEKIEIVAGDAGNRAALRGAAGLVLSELLQFPV